MEKLFEPSLRHLDLKNQLKKKSEKPKTNMNYGMNAAQNVKVLQFGSSMTGILDVIVSFSTA